MSDWSEVGRIQVRRHVYPLDREIDDVLASLLQGGWRVIGSAPASDSDGEGPAGGVIVFVLARGEVKPAAAAAPVPAAPERVKRRGALVLRKTAPESEVKPSPARPAPPPTLSPRLSLPSLLAGMAIPTLILLLWSLRG